MTEARVLWARQTVRLLQSLPAQSATALSMMYFSQLNQADITARTGWSDSCVRVACSAGLRELGRMLQAEAVRPTDEAT